MKKIHAFLISLGVLALAGVAIVAIINANKVDNQESFTVSGSGVVYAKADIANMSVGLKTDVKPTAAAATKENSEKMNEIIVVLKDMEIEAKDIKTDSYSLRPVYTWVDNEGQKLKGYEVYQNVTLKIRDLDKIGDIIAKTTEKGANQVGDISFTIDDEYELKNEARGLAIEKAKEKAEIIANQTGMKLGKIIGVHESYYEPVEPYAYRNASKEMAFDSALGAEMSSPEIEAGQNEVRVEVSLVYKVK